MLSHQPSPLRVLMATPRFFPLMGGVENHVDQVSRRLAKTGNDVTILTTDVGVQSPPFEKREGVQIQRVHAYPRNRDYYFAPDIPRVIAQGGWDVVHVQSYHTFVAPLAMWGAWRAHIPYVLTFHGGGHNSRVRNTLRGMQLAMLRPLLARAERLIATARFEVEWYGKRLNLSPESFVFSPNGGDIATEVQPPAVLENAPLIISVGRLERFKGHQHAIAAMPYVLAKHPTARLRVLGSGPYQAELERLAQELGISDQVEIRGVPITDRKGMASVLANASLVILLSEFETHPMAALEALALKRSVLVADTSGLRELAERGLARAISLDCTPQQVATAILEQLQNPIVPQTTELPTWDDCAAELLALYNTVARRQPCVS